MKRLVLDTSVIVAALRSRNGVSNKLLRYVANDSCKPLITTALFLEYEAVLLRPEQLLATQMSAAQVQGFLSALASAAIPVEVNYRWRPMLKDPADEMVLEAAINGQTDALITYNLKDFIPAKQFALQLLTPVEALQKLILKELP